MTRCTLILKTKRVAFTARRTVFRGNQRVFIPLLHTEGGMAKAFRVPERWRLQMTAVAGLLFLVAAQTLLPIEVGRWSVPGRNEFSSVGSGSGALVA